MRSPQRQQDCKHSPKRYNKTCEAPIDMIKVLTLRFVCDNKVYIGDQK